MSAVAGTTPENLPVEKQSRRRRRARLVGRRAQRRARLAADLHRDHHHRDLLPVAQLALPDGRQLRQPDRPGVAGDRHRHGHRVRPAAGRDRPVRRLRERHGRRGRGHAARARTATSGPPGRRWSRRSAPGLAIGLLQGFWFAKIGVPSFVVTLAGLLAWNGVVLQIIGSSGHDRHPGQGHQRPGQRLHEQHAGAGRADRLGRRPTSSSRCCGCARAPRPGCRTSRGR